MKKIMSMTIVCLFQFTSLNRELCFLMSKDIKIQYDKGNYKTKKMFNTLKTQHQR